MFHIKSTPSTREWRRGESVRIAKIILRQNYPLLALMSYRATPTQATKATPSQLMMGRRIRTTVPTLETNLQPKWPKKESVRRTDDKAKSANKYFFDKRHGVNNLPPLERGDQVKIKIDEEKEWNTSATVVSNDLHDRSYIVQTPNGTLRRNRRHLRPLLTEHKITERETEDQHAKTYHSVEESNHTPSVNETRKKVTRMNPESSDASERRTSCGRIVREPKRFIEEMY